jgi:hypothetical protein
MKKENPADRRAQVLELREVRSTSSTQVANAIDSTIGGGTLSGLYAAQLM